MDTIITVDESGDFNIPLEIKNSFNLKKDDKLFIFKNKDSIIIQKIQRPPLKDRFKKISQSVSNKFKEKGISEKDVDEAIQWARK